MKGVSSLLFSILLLVFISTCLLEGRTPGNDQSSAARIVSIPAIVTDKSDGKITALNASSFSLSVGGHNSLLASVQEVAPILVGTNKVKVPFVILDALGSREQNEARKECLQVLGILAVKGLPISLSEIDSDGLHEVHGVATSNSVLITALLQLDDESHFLSHRDQLQSLATPSDDKSLIAAETDRLRRFRRGSVQSVNMMGTIQAQLNALRQMAIALQPAKGRKTAIWMTGYFPIELNEAEDTLNINSYGVTSPFPLQAASIEYQKTIDLLNSAQISIFPVEMNSGGASSNLPGPVSGDRTTVGLRRIARSTGGEEMSFADGIENLVQHALDKSTNYYQLTFQPEPSSHLTWKTLRVTVNDKSLQVKSPDGLFLFPPK